MRTDRILVCFYQPSQTVESILRDKLIIHFQRQSVSGGREVLGVDVKSVNQTGQVIAVVRFVDPIAVETILSRQEHSIKLEGQLIPLQVEPYAEDMSMEGASTTPHGDDDDGENYESFNSWEDIDYFPDQSSSEEEDLYGASQEVEGKDTQNLPIHSPQGNIQTASEKPHQSRHSNNKDNHNSPTGGIQHRKQTQHFQKDTYSSPMQNSPGESQAASTSSESQYMQRQQEMYGVPERSQSEQNRPHQTPGNRGQPHHMKSESRARQSGEPSRRNQPLSPEKATGGHFGEPNRRNQPHSPEKATGGHFGPSGASNDFEYEGDHQFCGKSKFYETEKPRSAKRPREEHVGNRSPGKGQRGGRQARREGVSEGFIRKEMGRSDNQNAGYYPPRKDYVRPGSLSPQDDGRWGHKNPGIVGGGHRQREDKFSSSPQSYTPQAKNPSHSQYTSSDICMEEEHPVAPEFESGDNATIEVSKFKPTTSEDTLRMYFENKRKSGGGDIADFTFNQDVLTITFCDPAVAGVVARRTHKLEGATLTVIPAEKKKARPRRPVDKHCLLLTGIPDGVEQDTLLLFIEGRTKIEEDPYIVYGEIPGTAMLTYHAQIENIDGVIENFHKRKLKNSTVTASQVEFADCILVQNLKPGISQDTVELYFENERKSGGGNVRDVVLDEERNQAVVYFEDWKVVGRVTNRTHKLLEFDLNVTKYYDCLGAEVSTDGPTPRVPKPIVVQVNPAIAEYVFESGSPLQSNLEQEMNTTASRIEWPHERNKSSIKVTPDTAQVKDPAVWKDWKEKATQRLMEFFSEYEAEEFCVSQPFWDEICEKLQQLNLSSVRPLLRSNEGTILLLGQSSDVRQAKHQLTTLVDDLEKAAERARQIVTKQIKLRPEKFKLLFLCRVKEEVEQQWPDVKFTLLQRSSEIECEGMQGEVSEAQIQIYDKLDKLSEHTTEISANKGQFVNYVLDKIHEILSSRDIHAACNVDGRKLTVTGKTEQDTRRAIMFIKTDITEKNLQVENEATVNVLQSPKGKQCLLGINDQKAALAGVNLNTRQVEITGFKNEVELALGIIGEFIKKNVILEKHIKAVRGKVRYLTEQKGKDLLDISQDNQQHSVKVQSFTGGRQSGFLVMGTEEGMRVAIQVLTNLIEGVVGQQYPVAKPGIPQLLRKDKGKRFLKTVERECECVVDTNSSGFDSFDEDSGPSGSNVASYRVQILRKHMLPGGCQIMVCKGDLTKERVDAIVNAANTKLEHVGGLAKAILDAGGECIKRESEKIIREKGRPLHTASEVVRTSSGNLPCRHVLHVAGPRWDDRTPVPKRGDDPTYEENLLFDSVTHVLREAKTLQLQTISIPAISSGVYGFPIHLCAKTLVEATMEFCKRNKSSNLKEIRFTNIDQRACDAFLKYFQQQFGQEDLFDSTASSSFEPGGGFQSLGGASGYFEDNSTSTSPSISVTQVGGNVITTKENKTITLKKGDLAGERVDVIVNSTSGNFQLAAGGVSKAILAVAGSQLQQECDSTLAQNGQNGLGAGGILETGPAQLNCRSVYHTVCGHYDGASSESILSGLVMNVLQQANQAGMQSIAFPAIGTGNLKFPHDVAAQLMYEAAVKFSQQNPQGTLVDIRFVLYHRDRPTIQAFETEMRRLVQQGLKIGVASGGESNPAPRKLKKQAGPSEECSRSGSSGAKSYMGYRTSSSGTTEMKIGPIRVQVCHGDLTKESTEAIVNSIGQGLNLEGPVSKAIIGEGGRSIADECRRIKEHGGKTFHNGVFKTSAGTLNCNIVIHVVTPRNPNDLKDMVGKALQLAEKEQCKSIAFPALGTGNVQGDPGRAAEALLDAIGEFAASGKVKHLLLIKLTIYKRDMMAVFQQKMSSKEGESYKTERSLIQRGIDFVKWAMSKASTQDVQEGEPALGAYGSSQETDVDKATETMILHIFAGSRRNVEQAKDKIDEFIEEEYCREEMMYESEVWGDLDQKKMDRIFSIARHNSVKIDPILTGRAKRILIEGRTVDVKSTRAEIQKYFTDIQLEKKRELENCLINKEIQWRYEDNTGQLVGYGDDINPLIERAYRAKKTHIDLDLEEGKIRIDLQTKKERDLAGRKVDVDIQRIDLKKGPKLTLPSNWIPMNPGQNSLSVKVLQTSREYSDIEGIFKQSIGRNVAVIEIQRIQNEELFKQYTAKKERMLASVNRGIQVERQVYHGTAQQNCDKISAHGFNRSFHGANGTALGKGTYFARDASYSNGYAKPSGPNGYQHMFYCKVLTGEYTIGNQTMIAPPAKPGNPSDLYDSVVDRHPNPAVFVVFHDAQALPEYLIIFQ